MNVKKLWLLGTMTIILGTTALATRQTVVANTLNTHLENQVEQQNNVKTYTVRAGDTLWAIGMRLNIKPEILETQAQLANPYQLKVGTKIILEPLANNQAKLQITSPDNLYTEKILANYDKIKVNKPYGLSLIDLDNEQLIVLLAYYGLCDGDIYPDQLTITKQKNTYLIQQANEQKSVQLSVKNKQVQYQFLDHQEDYPMQGSLSVNQLLKQYYNTENQQVQIDNLLSQVMLNQPSNFNN